MTPIMLQSTLIDDLKKLLCDFKLKNTKNELTEINIYPQFLPSKTNKKDSEYFPYVVIRVMEGEKLGVDDDTTCKIAFVMGVYDEATDNQGYRDIMEIIERIKQHIFTQRSLGPFSVSYPFKWMVHDEEAYPYFFGGIETNWTMPQVTVEDELI